MNISLDLYKTFITVANIGSITLAAKELFLTQSAVSQSIRQLEESLESQLFIRSSRGVVLTDAGEVLMSHVGGMLEAAQSAERHFAQLRGLERGTLKIGASDTLCRHLLLPCLTKFNVRFPDIEIQVTNRTSGETAELVRQGKADIGFVNLPLFDSTGFTVRELREIHDCFVCAEKYFAYFEEPVHPQRIAEHPVLMLEGLSASRRYVDRYFSGKGISIKPQIELGSLDLLIEFAENNLGVAAVIREFLGDSVLKGRLRVITLSEEIPARHIGMITKKDIPLSFAGREFAEMLR